MTTTIDSTRPACAGETAARNPEPAPLHAVPPLNSARTGKIARLPQAIREELNRRLRDGQPGKDLVVWLNGLPEVQAILRANFEGRLITEQNLSEWRSGGYREWQHWEKTRELARTLGHDLVAGEGAGPSLDSFLVRLSRLYASMACESIAAADPMEGFRLLRRAFLDLSRLQRADLQSRRLALQQAREERKESKPIQPDQTKSHRSPEAKSAPGEAKPANPFATPPTPARRDNPPFFAEPADPEPGKPLTAPEPWWSACAEKPAHPGSIRNRLHHSRRHPIQSDQIQPERAAI